MAVDLHVTLTEETADPYYAFKSAAAKELLALFRAGARLCVWRCSEPWNYYLETDAGVQHHIGDVWTHLGHVHAMQALAKPGGRSVEVITRSLCRSENGLPQKEWWLFDAEKARAAETRWEQTCDLYDEREATARPPAPQLAELSERALCVLRTLRTRGDLPRVPELETEFQELDRQGLLRMRRNGRYHLVAAMRAVRIPRGEGFRIRYREMAPV